MKKIFTYLMVVTFVTVSLVSCDKKDADDVASPAPKVQIPELSEFGFYDFNNKSVFEVKSEVNKVGVSYGFFEGLEPSVGKSIIVNLVDGATKGQEVTVTVTTKSLDLASGEVKCTVENVTDKVVQLKSDKNRFVIPVKK